MKNLLNKSVVLESNKNEFLKGIVIKVNNNKALVRFESRGYSRWCNISNLEELS